MEKFKSGEMVLETRNYKAFDENGASYKVFLERGMRFPLTENEDCYFEQN